MTTEYAYSTDEENYAGHFATRNEAVAAALADLDEEDRPVIVWTGEVVKFEPNCAVLAEYVMEAAADQAADECGEWAGDWPDLPGGGMERMARGIEALIHDICPPSFYTVHKTQRHMIDIKAVLDLEVDRAVAAVIRRHMVLWELERGAILKPLPTFKEPELIQYHVLAA